LAVTGGWAGAACDLACPGGPNSTAAPGPSACLGRGACGVSSVGVDAVCTCVTGYLGTACEVLANVCGDGIINDDAGEECDDGASGRYCPPRHRHLCSCLVSRV